MGIFNSNYDFNKYKVFYAVAECKSFSKAAEILYISQPAVSHSIKELESQLNTKLFLRNKKDVVLTDAGEKLLYYVKNAFDNIMMAEDMLQETKDDLTGIIKIGIYSHISHFMLPNVIKKFNKKYPNAKFLIYSTSNEEMIRMLKNRELDFIILQYPIFLNDYTFKEEILCSLNTCFYASKKYYELYTKNNELFTDFPIILPLRGYPDIDKLDETLKKHSLNLKHFITSYTTELSINLVKEELGISWGLKRCIEKELINKELYEVPVNFEIPKATFSIAYNEEFLSNTSKEFIKYLKEEICDEKK